MNIRLHANATTTLKIRRFIRESDRPIAQLAKELHVSRVVPVDNFLIYKNIIRLDRPN